jgi:hypothetical protein
MQKGKTPCIYYCYQFVIPTILVYGRENSTSYAFKEDYIFVRKKVLSLPSVMGQNWLNCA